MNGMPCSMERFVAVFVVMQILAVHVATVQARNRSTLTLINQSGLAALVKVVGPTARTIAVPKGQRRTVYVAAGTYHLLVRYGSAPKQYSYSKGQPFNVVQTATQYSAISITLHKVVGGNYRTRPVSAKEFDKAAAGKKGAAPSQKK